MLKSRIKQLGSREINFLVSICVFFIFLIINVFIGVTAAYGICVKDHFFLGGYGVYKEVSATTYILSALCSGAIPSYLLISGYFVGKIRKNLSLIGIIVGALAVILILDTMSVGPITEAIDAICAGK